MTKKNNLWLYIIFICFVLIKHSVFSQSENNGWFKIEPLDSSGRPYYDLHFFNEQDGWIAGETSDDISNRFVIGYTNDGAFSWDTTINLPEIWAKFISFTSVELGLSGASNIFRTMDSGKTWLKVAGFSPAIITRLEFAKDSIAWGTGTYSTIIKTEDGGQTWSFQESGLEEGTFICGLSVVDSLSAYAIDSEHLIRTNDGENWSEISIPPQLINGRFKAVEFTSYKNGWIVGEFRSILHTSDAGQNWQDQSPPSQSDAFLCIDALDSLRAIAGTSESAIFRTDDGGKTWVEQLARGQYSLLNSVQMINDTVAYIVGHDGVILKTTNGGLSYIKDDNRQVFPKSFYLGQNYPNPFNASTTIPFSIPVKSKVLLKLYDLTGKKIRTLYSDERCAGKAFISFSLSNLSSGIYLYTMRANNFYTVKKLVLVK